MNLAQLLRDDIRNSKKYNEHVIYHVNDIISSIMDEANRRKYNLARGIYIAKKNKKDIKTVVSILKNKGFVVEYKINAYSVTGCKCQDCNENLKVNFKINWEDTELKKRQDLL